MGELRMPSLGADMDRGVLLEWKVKPGDVVQRGDIVAVVDTDKSDIDIEVFESGTVTELVVAEGTEVPVGTVLALLGPAERDSTAEPSPVAASAPAPSPASSEEAGPEPAPGPPPPAPATPVPATPTAALPALAAPATAASHAGRVTSPLVRRIAEERHLDLASLEGTGPGGRITRHDVEAAGPAAGPLPDRTPTDGRVPASPLARRRAAELGLDLARVAGTGPGGAVLAADVEAAAAHAGPVGAPSPTGPTPHVAPTTSEGPAGPARRDRAAAQRAATAALMARSKHEIPHYYLRTTIDLARARDWLDEHNRDLAVTDRVLMSVLLLKAAALAIADAPDLNGHWVDGALERHDVVDLGVAVALRGGGLVAPAIADAASRSIDELMGDLRDLVARARAGRLKASDLVDPSLTVTNLGDQGAEEVYGVIYPPQVALVGFGRVAERPWAVEGMLAVHPVVTATLAADHRVTTGHEGSRYLAAIDRLLQHPEDL